MKLIASLIVKDEEDRYLGPCVEHLLEFVDEIRVFDDGSEVDVEEFLDAHVREGAEKVFVKRAERSTFFEHEGAARQQLLDWTMEGNPSHVLAIDADEFVSNGHLLRQACQTRALVWTLNMREVWAADDRTIATREDGGWRSHPVPILYAVPVRRNAYRWRIANRALACGREPQAVAAMRNRARPSEVDVLHFGWANVAERFARAERYAVADGGKFHRSAHLDSILWPDSKVTLEERLWPKDLLPLQGEILETVCRGEVERRKNIIEQMAAGLDIAASGPLPGVPQYVPAPMLAQGEHAAVWRHPTDGRWVAINWDGTIETGTA